MLELRPRAGNHRGDASARTAPVRFISGPGADTLRGGGGTDVFLPGASAEEGDVIFGGGGLDTLDFAAATANLALLRDSIGETGPTIQIADDVEIAWGGSGSDDLFGFLRARGGAGNDSLTGARDEDSALFGDEGNDELFSLFVNGEGVPAGRRGDYLEGGAGDDSLSGGIGGDTFAGGNGDDSYDDSGGENVMTFADVTSDSQTGVTIDLSQRSATLVAGDGTDSLEDVFLSDVIGTRYADVVRGNELPNYLVGGDGDDTLFGGDQKDILLGGAGSDQLDGGEDFDLLLAFSDAADESPIVPDTLAGGAGFDTGLADEGDEEDVELLFTSLESLMSQF
jgi:Ca2+-binding RTX toxin-like protein